MSLSALQRFSFSFLLVIHRIQVKVTSFLAAKRQSLTLKMNPDKRRTKESFFLFSNKKLHNDEEQTKSNVIIASSSPSSESQNPLPPSSASCFGGSNFVWSLIDCILAELNDRFSSKTLSMMKIISTVYPESKHFLNINNIDEFSRHIDTDSSALKNEFIIIKSMLQSKTINEVIEFLNELLSLSNAFPQTLRMIKNAIAKLISKVTCERSFSTMKIIKNYLRNSMTDKQLSDLTVLAVERDFDINYKRVIDKFASNHRNCRILLR
jgi:hypothetical protein